MWKFWLGLALVGVALAIWFFRGRNPVVLRTLENGDRVLGPPSLHQPPRAPDDAAAVRRIARDPPPASRLAEVQPGQRFTVGRSGPHWIISDVDGRLAHVGRAGAEPDEPGDALTEAGSNLPDHGTLHVDRVLQDPDGNTIDLRGIVHPEPDDDSDDDG